MVTTISENPGRPLRMEVRRGTTVLGLVVTPDEVLIVDYKTNHAPPRSVAQAPPAYIRQLALYRAVLAELYPDKAIRAALVWTEVPDLMEISAPALDAALAGLTSR